jgi:queuosine precursor transporter
MFLDKRHKLFLVLIALFITCFLVGDIIGAKLVSWTMFGFQFTTTVGMVPFPVTFLLTDVINEFYGKRAARFITLTAFCMGVLSFAIIYLSGSIPIAAFTRAPGWKGVTEETFNNVFLSSLRIIISSLCAFLVSQFVDIGVFQLLKRLTFNRLLWLRASGSTVASQLIDTITITFVAWTGTLTTRQIINTIYTAYGLKILIAVGLTPLIYLCHALVERGLGIQPILIGDAPDDGAAVEAQP